jgi:hypothetical protein
VCDRYDWATVGGTPILTVVGGLSGTHGGAS